MAQAPDLKRIGRYDIERVLGEGAMGVVYEGNDTRLQRKVAIKTILKSALDGDSAKEYSMRFAREAKAVARLNHPNIVQVFDFAEEGDVAYIVMELVRGRELKTFFDAKERFELKESVHIMGELCEALHFAHEAGIIHRDIKPANVMIDAQGRVKLTDFGVARVTDTERTLSDKTQAGTVVGTPAYMSPEQIQGLTLDRRSDIFSAGVILYEFLCGGKPFTGTSAWTIAKKILNEDPQVPSARNPALSPLFDAVVAKALARDAGRRYQTAREMGYAVRRAFEGGPETAEAEQTQRMPAITGEPAAATAADGDATAVRTVVLPSAAPRTKATELEFWRSIKDGSDAADFQLYVDQFPHGIYVALAKRKIAKLQGLASGGQEQEKSEIEEAARREAEARQRLAEEKAAMEAALAKREAEFQQREAELSERESKAPLRSSLVPVLAALLVTVIALGLWQYFLPDQAADRVAELTRLLEESKQRETELTKSRQREEELAKELGQMRQREADARKAGDIARQRELAEQVKQREADAKRQGDLTRQREAEAKTADQRRAELTRQQPDGGRRSDPPKPVEPVRVTVATPVSPAPVPSDAPLSVEAMLQRAIALEHEGRNREARRMLEQAVREGSGQAAGQSAKRLGDMLSKGVPGVSRDYGEALRYYEIARLNGVEVNFAKGR